MAKELFRRRRIIVDRRFQLGISLKIVVFLAGYLVLFYLMAVFAPFLLMVFTGEAEDAMVAATRQVSLFVEQLLLPLGLTFACLALHCILLSHRIAGPVYRLRRTMEDGANRDFSKDIRLREGDYLTPLADGWNRMMAPLRKDFEAMRSEVRETLAEARGSPADALCTRRVIERLERMAGVLDEYRTGCEAEEDQPAEGAVVGTGETAGVGV